MKLIDKTYINKLFKKYKLRNGYYVSNNNIYKYQRKFLGYKIVLENKSYLSLIKINNNCNYFSFKRHTHDLKSHLNGIYGMVNILTFDTINDTDMMKTEPEELKELYSELDSMMNDIIHFSTSQIEKQEIIFKELNTYSLKDILIYYIVSYCSTFIVDDNLDIKIKNMPYVIKNILDEIKHIKNNDLLFILQNEKIMIQLLNNGSTITMINLEIVE